MPSTDQLLQQAIVLIEQARAQLPPDPLPPSKVIKPGDNIASILSDAPAGEVFLVDPLFVWGDPLVFPKPVTLLGPTGTTRVGVAEYLPMFTGGLTVEVPDVTLSGLEASNVVSDQEIVIVTGANCVLDRVRALGSPTKGQHRGIRANGANLVIRRTYIDHVFSLNQDSQAICGWDTPGPILIDDVYASGASETIMFGGADSATEAGIPSDITITNSTITKRPEWQGKPYTVKNLLELKNARRVTVKNCILEYCWAQGQNGFAIVLTPRNQSGSNPWSVVEDVLIQSNQIRHAACVLNILGTDDYAPSGRTARVQFLDNAIEDMNPKVWGPPDNDPSKLYQLGQAPTDISIRRNTHKGCANIGAWCYFYGAKTENLILTDNTVPDSLYGIWGELGGFDASTTGTCQNTNNRVIPQ